MNIKPAWPAPLNVQAFTTTRQGGVSAAPYDGNNLALHVGDAEGCVKTNRDLLIKFLNLPSEPAWLSQTHSTECVVIETDSNRTADAAVTRLSETPLVIMTADCLPILLCDKNGEEVAAIHAGWRGLVSGVIENTLARMNTPREQMLAWIGPGICASCFEVGQDVYDAYETRYPFSKLFFQAHESRFRADLPNIAENILRESGVIAVYQSQMCTYEQKNQFYSYRRDVQTGRMATLIWIKQD